MSEKDKGKSGGFGPVFCCYGAVRGPPWSLMGYIVCLDTAMVRRDNIVIAQSFFYDTTAY